MADIICPHCKTHYTGSEMKAGQRFYCTNCKRSLAVDDDGSKIALDLSALDGIQGEPWPQANASSSETPEPSVIDSLNAKKEKNRYMSGIQIGEGGMGKIFSALDRDIRREVAIKIIRDQSNEEDALRFVEEAQITGQLEHPNIVPVHELGIDGEGRIFFSMKRIRGRSLENVLDDHRGEGPNSKNLVPLPRLIQTMVSVCNAVAFAHSKGVIHRDLKPANIMLGDFGEVQLMDWGLAKIHKGAATECSSNTRDFPHSDFLPLDGLDIPADSESTGVASFRQEAKWAITRHGTIAGTPAYMPPEQARGEIDKIGEWSDIYSLGAILYEILTLYPPVMASTDSGFVSEVIEGKIDAPEVRAPRRNIPRELSKIATKALQYSKDDRYDSVVELQAELIAFLDGRTVWNREDNLFETIIRLGLHYKGMSVFFGFVVSILAYFATSSHLAVVREREMGKRTLEQLRENPEERQRRKIMAPRFFKQAQAAAEDMQTDTALMLCDAAVTYDPKLAEAVKLKAELLHFKKRYAEALQAVELFIKLKPDDPDGHNLKNFCVSAIEKSVR